MNRNQLIDQIRKKRSYLCVGLDTDIEKLPDHIRGRKEAIFEFNKAIIDATRDICVAYKINTAFYEAQGLEGWEAMERTAGYIGDTHFRIADAKRGDIGNTSSLYARAFFKQLPFDALTVAPYMGEDSLKPFLEFEGKWTIALGLTSNKGSEDFQKLALKDGELVYRQVIKKIKSWGRPDNLMFVIGATQSSDFKTIRELVPDHFFLVPGVGVQGGNLKDISAACMTKDCGLLVNASRSIIFASSGDDFAVKARAMALEYQQEMSSYLEL